ncbi:MAG: hypothetical protein IJP16_00890 [Clostridia bacterium]|nr:hypothetical protein [Clostridia bacterium]MBR5460708.1 hypothetical protein [Clostridia bacterium]
MLDQEIKMNEKCLEKMYDERDDLECAVSLLKKASTCISEEHESVQSDLAWVIEALEEEVDILESSISSIRHNSCRKGVEE